MITKYKCRNCGNIIITKRDNEKIFTKQEEEKLRKQKKQDKKRKRDKIRNYHKNGGRFEIHKSINGNQIYFCRTKTEKQAIEIVKRLRQVNWDKNQLEKIKKEVLG